ncbi:helix-turn-helix domain-containing protein [Maricaulis parjimensis]|uniref:helix-turn-helix domain-containing protein n=1 Tax=Maricaulis parjimensis TaxID=144023 RepID=UPI00193AB52F|nr:helix-turn-helix transcriptional regulator [Maricaulis parjimensis]
MTLSFLDLTQLLAAYHAALLALHLARRPRLAGLTLFCGVFAVHMATNLGVSTQIIGPELDITSAFGLLYGPAFYLFVRGLTREGSDWSALTGLHALPAIIIAVWQPEPPIPYLFGLPSLLIYIGLALRALYRHRALRGQWRSDDLAISLDWVVYALIGFAGLAGLDILREVIGFTSQAIADDLALTGVIAGVIALLTAMMVAACAHDDAQGALPDLPIAPADPDTPGEDPGRYGEAFQRIQHVLQSEQTWREPRLSVADLAKRLQISPREVSRAVNLHTEESFSRFINRYRIAALDTLMADPANHHRTLMDMAFDVGFNSKSAFNRIYREMTGQTPTDAFQAARNRKSVPKQDQERPET